MTDKKENLPNFNDHIPQLIEVYLNCSTNAGPGILAIGFDSETGECNCNYVTISNVPPEIKDSHDHLVKECSEEHTPIHLIFHDSDKNFAEGTAHRFKVKAKTPEDVKKEELDVIEEEV